MNFTISPKQIILIFSSSLNFKLRSKIWINLLTISNSIQKICLCKRLIGIHIQIIIDFTRCVALGLTIFEKSELANIIHVVKIIVLMNTTLAILVVFPGELWEYSSITLGSNVEHTGEYSSLNWHLHPNFSE